MQYIPFLVVSTNISVLLFILLFLSLGVLAVMILKYGRLYLKAITADTPLSMLQMIGMTLRQVDVRSVVEYRIMAKKAGIDIASASLEAHCLAGGNVAHVVRAVIAARKANIEFGFDHACAVDLAGRDVFDALKTSINPKVFVCPDPAKGCEALNAVTRDGILLKIKALVTLRTRVNRLIGGAVEETVLARVCECIIMTVGSAETYKKVLERPDLISKLVMERELDLDASFQILSVNIVSIDVGDNVFAKLLAAQAETDNRIAQAETDKRHGAAIAREREMKALAEENMAKILAAEAEVPKAIAQAFREGNLGVTDYYHIKNIQADTAMKMSISKSGAPPAAK